MENQLMKARLKVFGIAIAMYAILVISYLLLKNNIVNKTTLFPFLGLFFTIMIIMYVIGYRSEKKYRKLKEDAPVRSYQH